MKLEKSSKRSKSSKYNLKHSKTLQSKNNFMRKYTPMKSRDRDNDSEDGNNLLKITDDQIGQYFKERKIQTAKLNNKKTIDGEIIRKIDFNCAKELQGILNKQEKILDYKEIKDKEIESKQTKKNNKKTLIFGPFLRPYF